MRWVRLAKAVAAIGLAIWAQGEAAGAQSGKLRAAAPATESAEALNTEAIRLYQAGHYAEAVPLAQRALALREKALGPDHPEVGTALNNLALLYQSQGRYAEAEPLYRRSLTLYEKALGPDHASVGTALNNLAELYRIQGRY